MPPRNCFSIVKHILYYSLKVGGKVFTIFDIENIFLSAERKVFQ